MKITSSGLEHYQKVAQNVNNKGAAAAKTAGAPAAGRADKVTLSENAAARAELSRFTSALAAEAEGAVSAQRLGELREAVQNGSYHVESADIADAILDIKV